MKKLALAITTLFISCLAPAWAQQHLHATPPAALAPPEIAQAQVTGAALAATDRLWHSRRRHAYPDRF